MDSPVADRPSHCPRRPRIPRRQDGIIVLFTLLAVVLLLIASVALVRSFDTSLTLAGNMAFKRDLVNQSERAVAKAIAAVSIGGALASDATRQANSLTNNYFATTLTSEAHGIPTILVDDSAWTTAGLTATGDITDVTSNVSIRYVIDRLCLTGTVASSTVSCAISALGADKGGTIWIKRAGGSSLPVYRVSVRVTGPRNTQTFVQATISL